MSIFKETIRYIEEQRNKEWVGVPFNMGSFDKAIPYIQPKRLFLIFAQSGVGKSKFVTHKFLIDPYLFSKKTGYKLKIFYISLEVLKEEVMAQIISNFYYNKFGEKHSKEFFIRDKPSDAVMQKVYRLEEEFEEFSEIVTINDELTNPTGILKYVDNYYQQNGKIEKPTQFTSNYISNKNEHVIIITDTLNALHSESGKTKYETIFDYSQKYCKKRMVDFYGATVVNVAQQDKSSEASSFSLMSSKKIEAKTLPDRSAIAECKAVFNDANIVLSLYSPAMYAGIDYYPFGDKNGYDISKWQDSYRRIFLEKSRDGLSSYEGHLYFDGETCRFESLPPADEFLSNPKLYDKYLTQ